MALIFLCPPTTRRHLGPFFLGPFIRHIKLGGSRRTFFAFIHFSDIRLKVRPSRSRPVLFFSQLFLAFKS
jgi:hypothetical protein